MAAEIKLGSSLVKSVVKTRRAGYSRMAFMAAAVRVDCSVASCSGVGCSGTSGITKLGTTLVIPPGPPDVGPPESGPPGPPDLGAQVSSPPGPPDLGPQESGPLGPPD